MYANIRFCAIGDIPTDMQENAITNGLICAYSSHFCTVALIKKITVFVGAFQRPEVDENNDSK